MPSNVNRSLDRRDSIQSRWVREILIGDAAGTSAPSLVAIDSTAWEVDTLLASSPDRQLSKPTLPAAILAPFEHLPFPESFRHSFYGSGGVVFCDRPVRADMNRSLRRLTRLHALDSQFRPGDPGRSRLDRVGHPVFQNVGSGTVINDGINAAGHVCNGSLTSP